jgi:hypothetical protein
MDDDALYLMLPCLSSSPGSMMMRSPCASDALDRVCFFVLCNRHWFNRVPGSNLRIACLPSALTLMLPVPTYP